MVEQQTTEGPLELALVSCQTCDLAFIGSERRTTCPSCGGEAAGPYFRWTLEADGLRLTNGADRETTEEAPAAAGAEPAATVAEAQPAAEEPAEQPAEGRPGVVGFASVLGSFLYGGVATEAEVRATLEELGAEPEAAVAAVGRLVAVRELLAELAAAGLEPEVEVEVEPPESPAEPAAAAAEAQPEVEPEPAPEEAQEEAPAGEAGEKA